VFFTILTKVVLFFSLQFLRVQNVSAGTTA